MDATTRATKGNRAMNKITCPKCSSDETYTMWVDSAQGEYQAAECLACNEEWNECARDYHEVTE